MNKCQVSIAPVAWRHRFAGDPQGPQWQDWQVNNDPGRYKLRTEHWDRCQYIYEAEYLYSHDLLWIASDALEARDRAIGIQQQQALDFFRAIDKVLSWYPESAFPEDGESLDCNSASMARLTCQNIKREFLELAQQHEQDATK